jgi:hypothetical protein
MYKAQREQMTEPSTELNKGLGLGLLGGREVTLAWKVGGAGVEGWGHSDKDCLMMQVKSPRSRLPLVFSVWARCQTP